MTNKRTIIIGANSGIAKAITDQSLQESTNEVVLISRDVSKLAHTASNTVTHIEVSDYSGLFIEEAVNYLTEITLQDIAEKPITQVYICLGILHSEYIFPEKKLEDFNEESFIDVITANTLAPMLWLKFLTPLLTGKTECKVTLLSARVGSISENKLGGWYSYRASKATLNMFLKTAAIELARRAKNIKLIAFHPGTTDTQLSKPFQKNVPEHKLFTPTFVAKQLLTIVDKTTVDGELSYLDWQGKVINY